jgi:hypothetical protein
MLHSLLRIVFFLHDESEIEGAVRTAPVGGLGKIFLCLPVVLGHLLTKSVNDTESNKCELISSVRCQIIPSQSFFDVLLRIVSDGVPPAQMVLRIRETCLGCTDYKLHRLPKIAGHAFPLLVETGEIVHSAGTSLRYGPSIPFGRFPVVSPENAPALVYLSHIVMRNRAAVLFQ